MTSAACDYCGLPAAVSAQEPGPHFCCYGCRLASAAHAGHDPALARGLMLRLGLAVFFSMNVMVFTLFLWSQPPAEELGPQQVIYDIARYLGLFFATPAVLLLLGPLVEDAWAELRRGQPSLSLLLTVGVAAAYLYSLDSLFRTGGHVYFEVSCSILVFVTLGRWLEAQGKLRTTAALRGLQRLLPDEVRKLPPEGGEVAIARTAVQVGDRLRILPGERIPVDGLLQDEPGAAGVLVDEQLVTGESLPALKRPGDRLLSGVLNLQAPLTLETTAPPGEGFLARLVSAVLAAGAARDRYQRLAERLARWFLPLVFGIALAAGGWHAWRFGWEQGLLAALAVTVISCPCALGLATPMALWAALGRAARQQILVREGDALARLAGVRVIACDKTGTLTTGEVQVGGAASDDLPVCTQLAALLARQSNHPLARAIERWAHDAAREPAPAGLAPAQLTQVQELPGKGVVAQHPQLGKIALGSQRLMEELGFGRLAQQAPSAQLAEAHGPLSFVAWNGAVRGRIDFVEQLRPEAASAVAELQAAGLVVVILTGDRQERGAALARQLGVTALAELLPEDKLAALARLRQEYGPVAMVGDGVNDAPALAVAEVGVALGCGADLSRDAAAVCLLTSDLRQLGWLRELARETVVAIRWNLGWAFVYNLVGIGFAAAGLLHPVLAAVAMGASSLLVVANSLRLAGGEDHLLAAGDVAAQHKLNSAAAGEAGAADRAASTGVVV